MALIERELARATGVEVLPGDRSAYLVDATEARALRGRADAIALPRDPAEVAAVFGWCYERGVEITPRGGGTGYAGGAVPLSGGVVIALEGLRAVRRFEPELWRIEVEAGLRTADVQRLARENGLLFPPDPGAAEQSQIGGNIATNAGGPHAFKYGVTGRWVTGVEAVVARGELIRLGGSLRKDVAGYDLKSLLIGSEGTLGVITAASLALIPAPALAASVVAIFADAGAGSAAILALINNGVAVSALEYLDEKTMEIGGIGAPLDRTGARFAVIADLDAATVESLAALRGDTEEILGENAVELITVEGNDRAELWRWRDGVSIAVTNHLGGKASEDIVVPVERLDEAVARTLEIGAAHGLEACSWGHAGDGNVHATFLFARGDPAAVGRAERASEELFELAVALGGSISGEHGIGWVKRGHLERQLAPAALALHRAIKETFDPAGLLNPGKKT